MAPTERVGGKKKMDAAMIGVPRGGVPGGTTGTRIGTNVVPAEKTAAVGATAASPGMGSATAGAVGGRREDEKGEDEKGEPMEGGGGVMAMAIDTVMARETMMVAAGISDQGARGQGARQAPYREPGIGAKVGARAGVQRGGALAHERDGKMLLLLGDESSFKRSCSPLTREKAEAGNASTMRKRNN